MHLLERRVSERRKSDRGSACPHDSAMGANRRIHDRRVAACRKAMSLQRLETPRLAGVDMLKVERVTYVVNGNCFVWQVQVQLGLASRFMAGYGSLPEDGSPPVDCVVAAVGRQLQSWEELLKRR